LQHHIKIKYYPCRGEISLTHFFDQKIRPSLTTLEEDPGALEWY